MPLVYFCNILGIIFGIKMGQKRNTRGKNEKERFKNNVASLNGEKIFFYYFLIVDLSSPKLNTTEPNRRFYSRISFTVSLGARKRCT